MGLFKIMAVTVSSRRSGGIGGPARDAEPEALPRLTKSEPEAGGEGVLGTSAFCHPSVSGLFDSFPNKYQQFVKAGRQVEEGGGGEGRDRRCPQQATALLLGGNAAQSPPPPAVPVRVPPLLQGACRVRPTHREGLTQPGPL